MTEAPAPQLPPQIPRRITFYRHAVPVRLTHWVGVIVLAVLLMSGLQIFNAHPALYWGRASDFAHPIASIGAKEIKGRPIGVTQVFGHPFDTTGVLGVSGGDERGFPAWATLPSYQDLATGRRWHFFFAWLLVLNGLAYLVYGVADPRRSGRLLGRPRLHDDGRAADANHEDRLEAD